MLLGLYVFCLIQLGQTTEAIKAVSKIQYGHYRNNSIISYCCHSLNLKMKAMEYENESYLFDYADVFRLFQGMIHQYHRGDYQSAICVYHRGNYYGAHPIVFYRLYECYEAVRVGLYGKAFGCLTMAESRLDCEIPSINRNYTEKQNALLDRLNKMCCDVCGVNSDWDTVLYACSGCLDVFYCSRRCQKIGWNLWDHRIECSKRFQGFSRRLKRAKQSPLLGVRL